MTSPLLGSLAKTIGKAMGGLFLDATLTRDVQGVGSDPADPPAPTPVEYACKAIHEQYSERFRLEGLVRDGDRKVLILATSLDVEPSPGDRITIDGFVFLIINTATDPARAVWTCQARGVGAVATEAIYSPVLDFSSARNSQYLALLEDV